MNSLDKLIVNKFKSLLQEQLPVHEVILFGSRARGNADPESDMDVLVVLADKYTVKERRKVSICAWEAGFEHGIVVAPVVYSQDEWDNGPERYSPFVRTVMAEGIPV
ncbi:MAG: nucleotidyltransferase domain-containing protein [Candidatus Omnitrophota bacterium]|jgi:UTP:GlnB (protein PII) uridylyltransferase|nr:MAG: nucleotidyltransferase domain-containing protein [Candidatus Omnitrophota bacterium]